MINREIYVTELTNGKYALTAYIGNGGKYYPDHTYEGDHLETLIEDFKIDNPEYKDVAVSWE